ncbi:MAG: hypothetical protein J7M18_06665 [Candidatus Eremiobacteraeota bacterium]|nr:hypothetical protein [Candidatus Eremiobacteraeota bacterium]
MEGIILVVAILIFITQVLMFIAQLRLFEISSRLETANLILAIIANKLGATEEDVTEALSKHS